MAQQTAIQIGNSVGVIIPAKLRKSQGIKKGSKVYIEEIPSGGIKISDSSSEKYTASSSAITPDFKNWLNKFNKEYGNTLQELANK